MTDDFRTYEAERIRLLILQALAGQTNSSWTGHMIRRDLRSRGYAKPEEYVTNQLTWLANVAVAIKLLPAGDDVIATLRKAGSMHLQRVQLLAGIDKPDDED